MTDWNKELEQQLRGDLRAIAPPADFADAVMARIAADAPAEAKGAGWRVFSGTRARVGYWAAAAALLLAGVGGYEVHEARVQAAERRADEAAEQRFALAMRITGRTLDRVDAEVARAGKRHVERQE